MAQVVEHPTSAQFMGLSPTSGSVLTAQRLEPASDSVPPSLSPPQLMLSHFSKIKALKKNFFF